MTFGYQEYRAARLSEPPFRRLYACATLRQQMPRPRTVIIAAAAAWEFTAITTGRIPTISEVWHVHRHTIWRHLLMWVTGWTIWHLWGEQPLA